MERSRSYHFHKEALGNHRSEVRRLPKQIVLLSGSISSGKTALSARLNEQFGFHVLKTKVVIQSLARQKLGKEIESERRAMQKFGESLDKDTRGRWVRDALSRLIRDLGTAGPEAMIVVDAVRILEQIRAIRQARPIPLASFTSI